MPWTGCVTGHDGRLYMYQTMSRSSNEVRVVFLMLLGVSEHIRTCQVGLNLTNSPIKGGSYQALQPLHAFHAAIVFASGVPASRPSGVAGVS